MIQENVNAIALQFNDQTNFASYDLKKIEIESDESLSGIGLSGLNYGEFFGLEGPFFA